MAKAQFAVILGERFLKIMAAQCLNARPHAKILTVPSTSSRMLEKALSRSVSSPVFRAMWRRRRPAKARSFDPRSLRNEQEGLTQHDAFGLGHVRRCRDRREQQVRFVGIGNRLGLHRRIESVFRPAWEDILDRARPRFLESSFALYPASRLD